MILLTHVIQNSQTDFSLHVIPEYFLKNHRIILIFSIIEISQRHYDVSDILILVFLFEKLEHLRKGILI